jgi:hypothetical protein
MKLALAVAATLLSCLALAQDASLCDAGSPVDRVQITEKVGGIICKKGDEVLILPEKAVKREHLFHAGVSVGMPYFGYNVMYAQLKDGKPLLHVTTSIEGSLGANGVSVEAGSHFRKNSIFAGGTMRYYNGVTDQRGFMAGPTIGLAGTRSRVTGSVSFSYLAGYDTRVGGLVQGPELSLGLRVRLFRK